MVDEKATAVLLNWRRPENIPQIVKRLAEQPFVERIIIWDNAAIPTVHTGWFSSNRLTVIMSAKQNYGPLGRFKAIEPSLPGLSWIITQDDDCLVDNWPELWAERRDDRITANMHLNEPNGGVIPVRRERGRKAPIVGYDIWLGWGSVFRRSLIGDVFDRYRARWGEDDILLRDADRVFAVSLGVKHHAIQARCQNLPGIDGPMAIHKDGRQRYTKLARQRAAELVR